MDILITTKGTKVKIRVVGIVKSPRGFLFEKSDDGYIFVLGGKMKVGESSRETVIREVKEEIGMDVKNVTLRSLIENFYKAGDINVQEICFIYEIDDVFEGILPSGFIEVAVGDMNKYDIRPKQIIDILKNGNSPFKHSIIK